MNPDYTLSKGWQSKARHPGASKQGFLQIQVLTTFPRDQSSL